MTNTRSEQEQGDRFTKRCCILGLLISWVVTFVALGVGGYLLGHLESLELSFQVPSTWKELLPLIFNFAVTFLNEAMGYIHTCTLRWSLFLEDRLEFGSNLRLLSFPRKGWSNSWPANIVFMIGIVLTYASTSMVFLSLSDDLYRTLYDTGGRSPADIIDDTKIHVNPFAVLAFGAGLGLQAFITTAALLSTKILSWSSHPLQIARTCKTRINRRPGRCMMSVHMAKEDARDCYPSETQKAMIRVRPAVRLIYGFLVALPLCCAIWGIVVYYLIYKSKEFQGMGVLGKSWSFLPDLSGEIYGIDNNTNSATNTTTFGECHATSCTTGTSILNVKWTYQEYGSKLNFATVCVVASFQIVLTLSLHCAELLVNLSRDEDIARRLISWSGTDSHRNSVIAAITSWKTVTLFIFKALIHWMFGLALNVSWRIGICMYPPQIFYLSAGCLMTAAFGSWLVYQKKKGPLPSTFGHIQTIIDLIDVWTTSGAMYWGHKFDGDHEGLPSFAGTSADQLDLPYPREKYGGSGHEPADAVASGRRQENSRFSQNRSYQELFTGVSPNTHRNSRYTGQNSHIIINMAPPPYSPGYEDGHLTPSPFPSPGIHSERSRLSRSYRSSGSMGSDGSAIPLTSVPY